MLVVHAGAGYHSEAKTEEYRKVCFDACQKTHRLLQNGADAVAIVEKAIRILEDSPITNAGYGSNLTLDGKVECDASLMDGKTLHYGAVGALSGVKNPIEAVGCLLKRQISGKLSLGRVPPCTLVGDGACQWCSKEGVLCCDPQSMVTESAHRAYAKNRRKMESIEKNGNNEKKKRRPEKLCCLDDSNDSDITDTVGAVCIDLHGNAAAGVSSGGIMLKHPGRIGQAAVYGCGCWAQNGMGECPAVAVSTSGCGEHLIKTVLARECGEALKKGDFANISLSQVFKEKFLNSPFLTGSPAPLGGVIGIVCEKDGHDLQSEVAWAHSTETMCVGYIKAEQDKPVTYMSRQEKGKTSFMIEGCSYGWKHPDS